MQLLLTAALVLAALGAQAQTLKGRVVEKANGEDRPLPGANVIWIGTQTGTVTDAEGLFTLKHRPGQTDHRIVVSFVGFKADTLNVHGQSEINVVLQGVELEGVTVRGDRTDELNPIRTELITMKDLRKAACCNLSESFETQAAVDVSYTDAVSGAKQIQMLGLDGVYTQINSENMPAVRGLAARSGLQTIPGTWIRSIDVGKGTGSVVNGYESITGQINLEMVKPQESERFFYNAYASQFGRLENNIHLAQKINKRWSTGLLLHGSNQAIREDQNEDGFLDIPMFKQVNAMNRWHYQGDKVESQFGLRAYYDDRLGGQTSFSKNQERVKGKPYGVRWENTKVEGYGKLGIMLPKETESIGIIFNTSHHDVKGYWGTSNYTGRQQFLQLNGIFQTKFNEKHGLKTGLSLTADSYHENYNDSLFHRNERVAGVFAEYSYVLPEKFTLVAGLRYDRHNLFGNIVTPRLHLKYDFAPGTTLRLAAGRGFRYANVIVENAGYLVSNRRLDVRQSLRPEIAWNYGASFYQKFKLWGKSGSLTFDFFRTQFENQVIVDLDTSPSRLLLYNLDGKSYANSLQVQGEVEIIDGLSLTAAYKYYDVKATIGGQLRRVPFIPQDRVMVNVGYDIKRWRFDVTMQWFGQKRLPTAPRSSIDENGVDHADHGGYANGALLRRETSPHYFLFNSQVTRVFRTWEVYLGMENMGNLMQHHPILEHDNPWGRNFDAGTVWGPIMGRMLYGGVRIMIE